MQDSVNLKLHFRMGKVQLGSQGDKNAKTFIMSMLQLKEIPGTRTTIAGCNKKLQFGVRGTGRGRIRVASTKLYNAQ
jgi:hypothetical protein